MLYEYNQIKSILNIDKNDIKIKLFNGEYHTNTLTLNDDLLDLMGDMLSDTSLNTKGDYIARILKLDSSIKDIDVAIPLNIASHLSAININVSNMVTCYFKSGKIETINIIEYYEILKRGI